MNIRRKVAEQLIESLSNHTGVIPVDKKKFIELLTSINIEPTSKFYAELPDDDNKYKQLLQESRKYHYLSIRRILINRNANYNVSLVKKIWGRLISKVSWSSNVFIFTRSLRLNTKIVEILTESKDDFSLLAKLETYDYDNNDEALFVISKPILSVSKAKQQDIEIIKKWEEKNTFYWKEIGFLFFRYLKRISFKKYSACS